MFIHLHHKICLQKIVSIFFHQCYVGSLNSYNGNAEMNSSSHTLAQHNVALDLQYTLKSPSECSEQELAEFIELVKQGNAVNTSDINVQLQRAKCLLFCTMKQRLVAIGAIKTPLQSYKNTIFEKAGQQPLAAHHQAELGWISVNRAFRGLGITHKLIEKLVTQLANTSFYATLRVDNQIMRKRFLAHGMRQLGKAFRSQRGDYDLCLFSSNTL